MQNCFCRHGFFSSLYFFFSTLVAATFIFDGPLMLVYLEKLCKLFSKQENYFYVASVAEVCVFCWMLKLVVFLPRKIVQVNCFQK